MIDLKDIKNLQTQAQRIQQGDVFIALQGVTQHGLSYAQQALDNGAIEIWFDEYDAEPKTLKDSVRHVPQLRLLLPAILQKKYQAKAFPTLIGITGTNGKTSVAHGLAQALSQSSKVGVLGTLGNGIYEQGVSNLIDSANTTLGLVELYQALHQFAQDGIEYCVMEVSSHALDQGRIAGLKFVATVLTQIESDHLDYHQTLQAYIEAKKALFTDYESDFQVLNMDDAQGASWYKSLPDSLGYGRAHDAELHLRGEEPTQQGLNIQWAWQGQTHDVQTAWVGDFQAYNLLAIIAVLLKLGYEPDVINQRLEKLTAVPGRMQRVPRDDKAIFVDFAHTADALKNALTSLRSMGFERIICVFGCGGDRDAQKRSEMGRIAQAHADLVIVTDDNPRTESAEGIRNEILSGLTHPEKAESIEGRANGIARGLALAERGDVVLIAGKGHEKTQIIGTDHLPFDDVAEALK